MNSKVWIRLGMGLGMGCLLWASACGDDDSSATAAERIEATLAASPYADNPAPDVSATIEVEQVGEVSTVTVTVTGCPEGSHGIHIHEGKRCGDDGAEAGPHWTQTMKSGAPKSDEALEDPGDLGMVSCDAEGNGFLEVERDDLALGTGELTDPTGHAVVLHGLDSDDRIACGLLTAD